MDVNYVNEYGKLGNFCDHDVTKLITGVILPVAAVGGATVAIVKAFKNGKAIKNAAANSDNDHKIIIAKEDGIAKQIAFAVHGVPVVVDDNGKPMLIDGNALMQQLGAVPPTPQQPAPQTPPTAPTPAPVQESVQQAAPQTPQQQPVNINVAAAPAQQAAPQQNGVDVNAIIAAVLNNPEYKAALNAAVAEPKEEEAPAAPVEEKKEEEEPKKEAPATTNKKK